MVDHKVRELGVTDYFGEVSLIHDSVRTATVQTLNYCTLGQINIDTLYELASTYPFFKNTLMSNIKKYDDQVKIFLMTVLRDIPYLQHC